MAGHLAPSSPDEMIQKQHSLFPNSRGKSTVQADFSPFPSESMFLSATGEYPRPVGDQS
jgi:hypothetical protein